MPSILFVCTANICRSPLALALFRQKISNDPDASLWRLDSAGTWAPEGEPASGKSQYLLSQKGINIQNHRSKIVNPEMLRSFNLILTMERGHKEALQNEFPEIKSKVYMISEMIGKRYDIQDPYDGTLADYIKMMEEIEHIFDEGYEKIRKLAQDRAIEASS